MAQPLWKILRRLNPAQLLILSFAGYILFISLVLCLPGAVVGKPISWVQALFTATSATCVTGLVAVDTGAKFTLFGQLVILASIQLGGIGIMTMSSFILLLIGKRPSLQARETLSGYFPSLEKLSFSRLLVAIVLLTFLVEAAGALLLFARWLRSYPSAGQTAYQAVFHAISAFCNAGFSLNRDNLIPWASDLTTNGTIMALIIFGGLGFFVLIEIWSALTPSRRPFHLRFSFHTKLVLSMTVLILILGTAGFYFLEMGNPLTLKPFGFGQRLLRSLFQVVTARTAGFNTLPIENLTHACLYLLLGVMFVGAGPGSCAGGVKVTTAGVLLIVVLSRVRGFSRPSLFGRSLPRATIEQALTLIVLAAVFLALFILLILIAEEGHHPVALQRGSYFMELTFETVSAFGTVGLSTGLTPDLSRAGMLLISAMMFIGRLGPLTLAYALERHRRKLAYHYPEESVLIG